MNDFNPARGFALVGSNPCRNHIPPILPSLFEVVSTILCRIREISFLT